MNKNLDYINNKKFTLQGPVGNFFKKLELKLLRNNNVFITFNKGDEIFSLKKISIHIEIQKEWRSFINEFLKKEN